MSNDFELVRTKSGDELAAVVETLTNAGVPHRVAGTRAGFDITEVGRGDFPADMLVMVPYTEVKAARAALEASFAESELPKDHFLHTSTDEELLEILAKPEDWDPYLVLHARRLADARGTKLTAKVETKVAQLTEEQTRGFPAQPWQLILGWAAVAFGGVLGIIIGYSLAYSKEKNLSGEYFTYDEATRETGSMMLWCGLAMLIFWGLLARTM